MSRNDAGMNALPRLPNQQRPETFKLTAVCPSCGEAIPLYISRQDVKALYKAMKQDILHANRMIDKHFAKKPLLSSGL